MDTKTRTTRVLLTALLAIAMLGQPADSMGAGLEVRVVDGSQEAHQLMAWALHRYQRAGLRLPELEVVFHEDLEACRGHLGYWLASGRIDMCASDFDHLQVRKNLLHELAHAWVHANLAPERQAAFVALRGLDTWSSHDHAWEERAIEHAAEVIAWGLMDERLFMPRLPGNDPEALVEAFEFLTGAPPADRLAEADLEEPEITPIELLRMGGSRRSSPAVP